MIADPYTKLMTAFMDVDMAAGVLLATHDEAESLGVPRDRRVYLRGWAFARDATHLAARADLSRSAAMQVAATEALATAGATVDDVAVFDLYSCFSAALGFASDALGLRADDARSLTVTGALPYHGGPSSNYMSHSIGHLVDQLRGQPGTLGLVSGIGMHMTKHVFACYSTSPGPVRPPDYPTIQETVDRCQHDRVIVASATGPARILAATTVYDQDSVPASVLAVCELADGRRAYARSVDPDVFGALSGDGWIGRRDVLRPGLERPNSVAISADTAPAPTPTRPGRPR
jgi:acetyl-CoA C-acetyltransferase